MTARLVLMMRWIALAVLVLAILLIIARRKLPMRDVPSESTWAFLKRLFRSFRLRRQESRAHEENLRALRSRTALVIGPEDKPMRVMAWKLEGLGCVVTKASNGSRGIALFESQPFDLVIADSLLPDISAVDLYNSLAGFTGPIVFVGVLSSQQDDLRALGRNVICADRPFHPEEIAASAGHMLRTRNI